MRITFEFHGQNLKCSQDLKNSIDENIRTQLLTTLDSFVSQIITKKVSENLLWKTEALFSKEIYEKVQDSIESNEDSSNAVHISLLNSYPIGRGRQLNQIGFFKQKENDPKSLQMVLNLIAHLGNNKIRFSTPLSYYTETWKEHKIGSINYYYRDKLNIERGELCDQKNKLFASRFNIQPYQFNFFMVENYQEILHLIGIDYNVESIGQLRDGYGIIGDEVIFSVMNNEDFSHDLFHFYLQKVHDWSANISQARNWVVEEGVAYSWGNAYYTKKDGEMAEQKELANILYKHLAQNKNTDLLQLFVNNFWSDKSEIFKNLAPDIQVGRLISSLICDEVQRVHGMKGINYLLIIGSNPNHFDPFFEAINKLVGINRENFNDKFTLLINKSIRN